LRWSHALLVHSGTAADREPTSSDDSEDDQIANVEISNFKLSPSDFGLPCHSLDTVHGGKGPSENAEILMQILRNERAEDDPVLQFVLLNTAALITVSGICEAEVSKMGEGDDGKVVQERGPGGLRWKEGLRRAKWCIQSGAALAQWEAFVGITNELHNAAEGKQ
jgi:anthranilate phosphoribosyltransferase